MKKKHRRKLVAMLADPDTNYGECLKYAAAYGVSKAEVGRIFNRFAREKFVRTLDTFINPSERNP